MSDDESEKVGGYTFDPDDAELAIASKVDSKGSNSTSEDDEVARWELKSSDVIIGERIGKGSYGSVYKGKARGVPVAVKKLYDTQLDAGTLEAFRKEVAIMTKLRHPHVLLFMGACTEPGNLLIVTELMTRGSVYDLLHNEKVSLTFAQKMRIAKHAALGMCWLHSSTPVFIHRDLKTGNLLVDESWNVKVSDFGLSHIKQHNDKGWKGSYGAIGTPLWMAPEVLLNKAYDEKADLYSFAIVIWELLTGEEPFPDIDTLDDMLQEVCILNSRPVIPANCSKVLSDLITKCWDPDPEQRPNFADIWSLFDSIVIEETISDEHGRKLWEKHFLEKESVAWEEFLRAFKKYWNVTRTAMTRTDSAALRSVVTIEKDPNIVTMETFGKMLYWFGPADSAQQLLSAIKDVLSQPYFFGEIGALEAEKLLVQQNPGTFLIRFSARDPGCYAISALSQSKKVKHYRVYHKPGGLFQIGKIEVESIHAIVKKYGQSLGMVSPCPGSPYEKIFTTEKKPSIAEMSEGYLTASFEDPPN